MPHLVNPNRGSQVLQKLEDTVTAGLIQYLTSKSWAPSIKVHVHTRNTVAMRSCSGVQKPGLQKGFRSHVYAMVLYN